MSGAHDTTRGWEGCYVTLQESYVRDLRLGGPALLAYAIIRGFAAATGECTSTLAYFEWWLGCSKPTAIAAVHELERLGLVSVGKRRTASGPLQNVYRLTDRALKPHRQPAPEGAWAVDDDSITIKGEMVSRLGLSGRDLVCYATLFARCQDGCEHVVPLSHIAAWMGSSPSTARRSVARLEEAGLVMRRIVTDERHVPQALYRLADVAMAGATDPTGPRPAPATNDAAGTPRTPLAPRLVGPRAPRPKAGPRPEARDAMWSDFARLRPIVPTTRGFDYGIDAYRALRARGVSHEEIEGLVGAFRRSWRESHPDRSSDFAPHCERVLREISRDLGEAGAAPRAAATQPIGDDLRTLLRALQLEGRLGHESDRLATERQRAASANDREALAAADARIYLWCSEHEAEVWGTAALAHGAGVGERAAGAAEGAASADG